MKNELRDGKGILKNKWNDWTYVGDFKKGSRWGRGLQYGTKTSYYGGWREGKEHGRGS